MAIKEPTADVPRYADMLSAMGTEVRQRVRAGGKARLTRRESLPGPRPAMA